MWPPPCEATGGDYGYLLGDYPLTREVMESRRARAVSLGDGSLRSLAMAGRVDVHDPASLATADAMFRGDVAPWSTTWF